MASNRKKQLEPQSELLGIRQLARELGCSRSHVVNILAGRVPGMPPLPHIRLGRRITVRPSTLRLWLAQLEEKSVRAAS